MAGDVIRMDHTMLFAWMTAFFVTTGLNDKQKQTEVRTIKSCSEAIKIMPNVTPHGAPRPTHLARSSSSYTYQSLLRAGEEPKLYPCSSWGSAIFTQAQAILLARLHVAHPLFSRRGSVV